MKASISLLVLLFSMCGAQTGSSQTEVQRESQSAAAAAAAAAAEVSTQLDISAELKELREMVVELRVMLRYTQDDLKLVEERLGISEIQSAVLTTEVKNLKKENEALSADLRSVAEGLAVTKSDVENLEETSEKSKVAFSAGLPYGLTHAPPQGFLRLVFSEVITNVGQAYNSSTGYFTAPLRGVYYFRFTVMDKVSDQMFIMMYKNDERFIEQGVFATDGKARYLSGGLTQLLEVGDVIHMVIPPAHQLYNDPYNHSTFSGFLLFPL